MTYFTAVPLRGERHILAEGPVWIAETSSVLWVDVERGRVFEGVLTEGAIEQTARLDFPGRVGAAVRGDDGSLLVATERRLVIVAPDGTRTDGPAVVADGIASRVNDGACDPLGRFVIGTLALDEREGTERLLRVGHDGSLTVIDSDLTLSNGLAWSPDGSLLYSTDSVPGVIWVRDYDAASGKFGTRREHLRFGDGSPDGICVDVRGHLWVAIWGAGEVRSFDPDGVAGDTVRVAAPHVSSVAFVGDDRELLLITTASRDLDASELPAYPNAGRLFLVDVGVAGAPTTRWNAIPFPGTGPATDPATDPAV
jgi:sugar lactone lactonase YvrE